MEVNFFASAFYLIECVILATLAAKWYLLTPFFKGEVAFWLVWFLLFFIYFFGGFYLLGYLSLIAALPVVTPAHAALLMLAIFVVSVWVIRRRKPSLLQLSAYSGCLVRQWRLVHRADPVNGISRVLFVASLATFGAIALMLCTGFPRGYEPLAYHLPIAIHIFQSQTLNVWDTAFMHTFPANASIYYGFLLGFIPERLVAAADIIFLIPLCIAVYGLGRAVRADKEASLIAAIGLVTIPIVAFSAFEAGADVGGMAFLAVAVYFIIVGRQERIHLVLAGLAAGLAFGFKSLHLVSIAFLSGLVMIQSYNALQSRRFLDRVWSSVTQPVIFLSSVLAVASFWLVRNYLELGNPLYPIHLPGISDILGWVRAPDIDYTNRTTTQFEWVRTPSEWALYPWLEWHYINQNFKHSSGLGAFFAATVPVATLVAFIGLFKRQKDTGKSSLRWQHCLPEGCLSCSYGGYWGIASRVI